MTTVTAADDAAALLDALGYDQVGRVGEFRLPTGDGAVRVVDGRFIGVGTSRADRHSHPGPWLGPDDARCGACRWFETRIFSLTNGDYVVHIAGRSDVPDETQRCRIHDVITGHEVLEVLTTRRVSTGSARLGAPAARALAQAAGFDPVIRDVFERRKVV